MGREMFTCSGDGLPRAISSLSSLARVSSTSRSSSAIAALSSAVSIFWYAFCMRSSTPRLPVCRVVTHVRCVIPGQYTEFLEERAACQRIETQYPFHRQRGSPHPGHPAQRRMLRRCRARSGHHGRCRAGFGHWQRCRASFGRSEPPRWRIIARKRIECPNLARMRPASGSCPKTQLRLSLAQKRRGHSRAASCAAHGKRGQ